jgi:sugar/nucleoside kinase (ribokinase family)
MKSGNPSCLVIGDINIDFNIHANAYPPEGGETNTDSADLRLGGSACSTALVLQKLGIQTSLAANIGMDVFANFAMKHIQSTGMDVSLIQHLPDLQTGFFMVLITPVAQRTMFGKRGANTAALPLEELLIKVDSVDHLHVSGYSLIGDEQGAVVTKVVEYAKAKGKTVSLDPGVCASDQIKEKILKLLPFVDYFIPSQSEVASLANDVHEDDHSSFLLNKECLALVLKQAENGSSIVSKQNHIHAPAISIENKIINNTTGAGDSFNAGFLYGILSGHTPEQALRFGNAAGYAVITSQHGILDLINKKDLEKTILKIANNDDK